MWLRLWYLVSLPTEDSQDPPLSLPCRSLVMVSLHLAPRPHLLFLLRLRNQPNRLPLWVEEEHPQAVRTGRAFAIHQSPSPFSHSPWRVRRTGSGAHSDRARTPSPAVPPARSFPQGGTAHNPEVGEEGLGCGGRRSSAPILHGHQEVVFPLPASVPCSIK